MTTESPVIDTARGTVAFSRKVSVRQYESAEASIYVQFDIPTDPQLTDEARGEAIIANARAAFFQAKALVLEELGLEFSVTEGGVIMETLNHTFGKVTEVTPTPAAVEAAPTAAGDDVTIAASPPFSADTKDKGERAGNKAWATKRYAAFPDEFYDNRDKKASGQYKDTAPDVKHKTSGVALWL